MKKFRNMGIAFLLICAAILIYTSVTAEGTGYGNASKVYDFNDGWIVKTSEYTEGQEIELPYSAQSNDDIGKHDTQEPSAEKDGESVPKEPATENPAASDSGNPKDEPQGDLQETYEENVIILENTLPAEYAGYTLSFLTNDSHFKVTIDGTVVYDGGYTNKTLFDLNLGNSTNLISIPEELTDGVIRIEFTNANKTIRIGKMSVSSTDTAVLSLIMNNIFNLACGVIIMFAVIMLLILMAIQKVSGKPTVGSAYLCMFGFAATVYYALKTEVFGIFFANTDLINMAEAVCILMMSYLILMYYGTWERSKNWTARDRKHSVTFVLVCAVILMQLLLQIFQVISLTDLMIVNQLLLLAAIVMILICIIAVAGKLSKVDFALLMISFSSLLLGVVGDFIMVYALQADGYGTVSRYGATVFMVLMLLWHVKKTSGGYLESVLQNQMLLKREVTNMEIQNEKLEKARKAAEQARAEADLANEAKGRFLANMSHEIRTPINAILGMDAMILRESAEPSIREYAMDIKTAGDGLLSLVNEILDFSKIESGKMELTEAEYDVSSMIHDLMNMIQVRAAAKQLPVNLIADETLPSRLYGDDGKLRQVLTNILTNAVKYTSEGSVTLTIGGSVSGDVCTLCCKVEDTGIGIRQEDMGKLFEEFERLDVEKNRSIEGTGLGMNITVRLLELMGSRLHVESEYGQGSCFSFEVKQKVADAEPIGDLAKRIRDMASDYIYTESFTAADARLLVVDDNAVNRKVFRNLLKRTQIQIDEAAGGKETLALVAAQHYDIIFLDHMMPEMDGIETLARMKELPDNLCKDTPVIALTANAVTGAKEMYLAAGFDAFLSKPVNPEKLEKMIAAFLPEALVHQTTGEAAQAEPQAEPSLPELDGFDWNYARAHLGSMELVVRTVRDFYVGCRSEATALQGFYEAEDYENYRIKVHSMKSAAALIGALPLSGLAKTLEYAARDGRTDVVRKVHDVFMEEWSRCCDSLSAVCGGDEPTEALPPIEPSVLSAYLEMLTRALYEMDIDRQDEIMAELKKYSYPAPQEERINRLAAAVQNIDSDAAEAAIKELTNQTPEEKA